MSCFRRAFALSACVVVVHRPLHAQTLAGRPTLRDVMAYALRFSPDVATAREQVDSARGERRIARALPNPAFTVTPGTPFQYTINQAIDVGPDRFYRSRAAARGAAAVELDLGNTTRQVVFATRSAFLDLLLAEATRDIAFEQDTVMHHLLETDSIRFREGDLAQRDVGATELQAAHADAALARAESGARATRIALQLLIGVPHPDPQFRVSGDLAYQQLDVPFDSLRAMALASRPDIAAADTRVEQSRAIRSLANSLAVPVPGIAAVYQPTPFESGRNYALGFSLSLPVWYWFGGERERANAGLHSSEIALQHSVASAEGDVTAASDDFRAARTLAARYADGLLEHAQATLAMQRFAYDHGNASLVDLLNAISAFGDTRTDYFTVLHDYWVAAYAIDRAVGRDIIP